MHVRVILEPSEEGGYAVHVPSLPGCISEGDTREDALANIPWRPSLPRTKGQLRGPL